MASQHILHDCMASEYKPHAACLIRPRTIVQQQSDNFTVNLSQMHRTMLLNQPENGPENGQGKLLLSSHMCTKVEQHYPLGEVQC